MHGLLFYGENVKVVRREFEQVKALRSSNRGVCITWIASLIKFQQKNIKKGFQLYNCCCCCYYAAMKYSNLNLIKFKYTTRESEIRHSIVGVILQWNIWNIKNWNWIHSKRISNRTFRKMVLRLRTNPS